MGGQDLARHTVEFPDEVFHLIVHRLAIERSTVVVGAAPPDVSRRREADPAFALNPVCGLCSRGGDLLRLPKDDSPRIHLRQPVTADVAVVVQPVPEVAPERAEESWTRR